MKNFLPTVVFITLFADCRVHYFTSTNCAIHSPKKKTSKQLIAGYKKNKTYNNIGC